MSFDKEILTIDPGAETERLVSLLRYNMGQVLRRRGAVVDRWVVGRGACRSVSRGRDGGLGA